MQKLYVIVVFELLALQMRYKVANHHRESPSVSQSLLMDKHCICTIVVVVRIPEGIIFVFGGGKGRGFERDSGADLKLAKSVGVPCKDQHGPGSGTR